LPEQDIRAGLCSSARRLPLQDNYAFDLVGLKGVNWFSRQRELRPHLISKVPSPASLRFKPFVALPRKAGVYESSAGECFRSAFGLPLG
jgi:hypothetical protein